MSHSYTTECEDGVLSFDSPLSNDGDNFGGSSNGGVVLKKGPWTSSEDAILVEYVKSHGEGNWNAVQRHSALSRCGKSCRLRWANHLWPNLKKGAFTQEEEQIIIELHAKLGNKWARMAAHLPGRTDNEIKNYWNTRIKRRHRAGLPLYPPDLCLHAPPENQQQLSSPTVYSRDKGCHDIWQTNGYGTPDITFDSSNILPFTTESPGLAARFLMGNGFSSPLSYSFVPQTMGVPKRTLEPDEPMSDYQEDAFNEAPSIYRTHTDSCANTTYHSFGLYYPPAPDHTQKLSPSGFDQDSPFISSVIFSASERFTCARKSELPSLQYHETGIDVWDPAPESLDSFVSSPLSGPLPSRCPSPGCSGLLEDLVYESKVLVKSENQSSNWATLSDIGNRNIPESSTLKMCNTEFIGCIEHGSSIFNRYTRTGTMGSSLGEDTTLQRVKSEVFDPSWNPDDESTVNSSRPGAILGSYWVEQSACHPKQQGSTSDAITALLEDDLGTDLKNTSYFATAQPFFFFWRRR